MNPGELQWDPDHYINPISHISLLCQLHLKHQFISFCMPFLLYSSVHFIATCVGLKSPVVQGSFLLLIDEDKLQRRLVMLFVETCKEGTGSSSCVKNWSEPPGDWTWRNYCKQKLVWTSSGTLWHLRSILLCCIVLRACLLQLICYHVYVT